MLKKTSILISVFSFFASLVLGAAVSNPQKPNIVIIYTDDMGYGQPSCYGGTLAETPHMDALAANGVRFTQGYVSACVCSPSRVGLLTGRYQARFGHDYLTRENEPLSVMDINQVTLADRMKAAGYITGIIGKWHVGQLEGYRPNDRGFDWFYGVMSNKNEQKFYRQGTSKIPKPFIDNPPFNDSAIAFIEAYKDRPFFLYYALTAIHSPHEASPQYLAMYAHIEDQGLRNYAAMIAETDAMIGALVNAIRRNGLEDNTLIFHISDNGGEYVAADNGPYNGGKWSLYEGGIRVPFTAQWPGRIPAGQVIDEPVIQLDVMPTILKVAGVTVEEEWKLDGLDLMPLMSGEVNALGRDTFYWRYLPQFAVRKGKWKLVKPEKEEPVYLFDLESDPGEQSDLRAKYPEKFKEMMALYEAWDAKNQPNGWVDERAGGLKFRKQLLEERRARKAAQQK